MTEEKKDTLSKTVELLKKSKPTPAVDEPLTLEEAEVLTRGHEQAVRDWVQIIYAAGYQITRMGLEP